ncbi:MAG: hypothetical protein ACI9ZF_001500 [Bradyrhizobium sp.]|jgi:hypothetical protein
MYLWVMRLREVIAKVWVLQAGELFGRRDAYPRVNKKTPVNYPALVSLHFPGSTPH